MRRGLSEKGQERDRKRGDLKHLSINQCLGSALSYRIPIFETSATALCGTGSIGQVINLMDRELALAANLSFLGV